MGHHDSGYERAWTAAEDVFDLIADAPAEIAPYLPHLRYLLLDANAFPAERLEEMRNPVACLLWLEGSETMTMQPIGELDKLLARPEDAGLRRAFSLDIGSCGREFDSGCRIRGGFGPVSGGPGGRPARGLGTGGQNPRLLTCAPEGRVAVGKPGAIRRGGGS